MSGFAVVAAATIIGLMILTAYSASTTNLTASADDVALDMTTMIKYELSKDRTELTVNSSTITVNEAGTQIRFNVTNTGSVPIRTKDFKYMDVVATYTLASTESLASIWLPYSSTAEDDAWTVEAVYTNGKLGEAINTIDQTTQSGKWDPSETLKILIQLSTSNAVNSTYTVVVSITAPNGVGDYGSN